MFRLSGPRLGSSVFTQGRRQQTTEQTLSPVHKQPCDLLMVLHCSTVPRCSCMYNIGHIQNLEGGMITTSASAFLHTNKENIQPGSSLHRYFSRCPTPLSTGSLYPKFREQTSGIIQKLYETKTNTNTGWFKSVYWLFSEIKPKMCDFARFHCFSSKNGLNCNMTFR